MSSSSDTTNQDIEKTDSEKQKGSNTENDIYEIIYNETTKEFNMPEVDNDCELIQAVSDYLQRFVKITNMKIYSNSEITITDKKFTVEDSLPLVQIEQQYYAFPKIEDLNDHCEKEKLFIKSQNFNNKSIPKNFSEEARKLSLFDKFLILETEKYQTKEYIINGEKKVIRVFDKEYVLDKIIDMFFNKKKFISIKIIEENQVKAHIKYRGDNQGDGDKETHKLELTDKIVNVKDFLKELSEQYDQVCKIKNVKYAENDKILEIGDNDECEFLEIKDLNIFPLHFKNNGKILVSKQTRKDHILKVLGTEANPGDVFFYVENKLLLKESETPYKLAQKGEISIFNLSETPIKFEFKCDAIFIDPISIKSANIGEFKTFEQFKTYFIEKLHFLRKKKDIRIKYKDNFCKDDQQIYDYIELDKKDSDKCCKITFDVIINAAQYKFKGIEDPDNSLTFTSEKVSILCDKFSCDKIDLYDDGEKISNDRQFLFLDPGKTYDIKLFDYYYIKEPNKDTDKLLLPRKESFEKAISSIQKYSDIPYRVYDGKTDISKSETGDGTKNRAENPYFLKVRYVFRDKETSEIKPRDSDADIKVKIIAADLLGLAATDIALKRVQASLLDENSKHLRDINDNDIFANLDYKKGYIIEMLKLPRTLTFIFDTTDLEDVLINNDALKEDLSKEIKQCFDDRVDEKEAKVKIREQFNIVNDIEFIVPDKKPLDKESLDKEPLDNKKMTSYSESETITIQILPPKYTFRSIANKTFHLRLKKNCTVKDIFKVDKFKSRVVPAKNHDVQLVHDDKKLKETEKIFDYYKKGEIKCIQLDPLYHFHYDNKKYSIRIPDGKTFKEVRNYVYDKIDKLRDIDKNRIKFYESIDSKNHCKCSNIISTKFNKQKNEIIIKVADPKYTFKYKDTKKIVKIRFNKEATVKDAIEYLIKEELASKRKDPKDDKDDPEFKLNNLTYDIKLCEKNDDDDLNENDNLFNKGLSKKKNIKIQKIPIEFHFHINKSENDFPVRFWTKRSYDISFYHLVINKLIQLNENLVDFTLLPEPNEEEEKSHLIPPIERFRITNEDGEPQKAKKPFFSIINGDKSKFINIELLPPTFIFKLINVSVIAEIRVERRKVFADIKQKIAEELKLIPYDFYIIPPQKSEGKEDLDRTSDDDYDDVKETKRAKEIYENPKMKDDSSFDEYEQNKDEVFTVVPQNPTYKFIIKVNDNYSKPKLFRFHPKSTVLEIKAITLPNIKPKRLSIYGPVNDEESLTEDSKPLNDNDSLPTSNTEKPNITYIIDISTLKIPIKMPEFDSDLKDIEIPIKTSDTVGDIKEKVKKEAKGKEIELYLLNKKLDDKEKYNNLIFTKNSKIECKYTYNLHFKDEQFKNLDSKMVIDNKLTVFQCRKKCHEIIQRNGIHIVNNLKRIQLQIDGNTIGNDKDDQLIYNQMKDHNEFTEVTVLVDEDEVFTNIKRKSEVVPEKDKSENNPKDEDELIQEIKDHKFTGENTVMDIRKIIGNDFIIRSAKTNAIIFDDQPLFSIANDGVYIEKITHTKYFNIKVTIPNDLSVLNPEYKDKQITHEFSFVSGPGLVPSDVKETVLDNYLTEGSSEKINLLVKVTDNEDDDPYLEGFRYANYEANKRILSDTQNLVAVGANKITVIDKAKAQASLNISAPPLHVLYYVDKNKEAKIDYTEETSVSDIIGKLDIPIKDPELQPILIYLGKILKDDDKIKDILIDGNYNFYCRISRKMPEEDTSFSSSMT